MGVGVREKGENECIGSEVIMVSCERESTKLRVFFLRARNPELLLNLFCLQLLLFVTYAAVYALSLCFHSFNHSLNYSKKLAEKLLSIEILTDNAE